MVAIVVYEEANTIAIISILISMLSAACKSFIFSVGFAKSLKQLFFNWISAVTDFFGVFCIVSWVFYQPKDNNLQHAFEIFQNIWLYRIYICTLPLVILASLVTYGLATFDFMPSRDDPCCQRFCGGIVAIIMLICGIIATTLAAEIAIFVWPVCVLFILGTSRFPDQKIALQFYFMMIGWINQSKKHHVGSRYNGYTSYTKYQDKMMRLASFHYMMGSEMDSRHRNKYFQDHLCIEYLEKEQETNYMNVTMSGLRANSRNRLRSEFLPLFFEAFYAEFWLECWEDFKTQVNNMKSGTGECKYLMIEIGWLSVVGSITFVCGPIYFLSRIVMLFFPPWIVLYLYFVYDVNIWTTTKIDLFQVVMITIYMSLCGIVWILFIVNIKEQYLMHHIFPSDVYIRGNLTEEDSRRMLKKISSHYFGIIVVPIRKAMIIEHFGPDLGPIILSYLPAKDEYGVDQNITKVRIV